MIFRKQGTDIYVELTEPWELAELPFIFNGLFERIHSPSNKNKIIGKLKNNISFQELIKHIKFLFSAREEIKEKYNLERLPSIQADQNFKAYYKYLKQHLHIDMELSRIEKSIDRKLYLFQREAVIRAIARGGKFAFFHDTGLGKTLEALITIKYFYDSARVILIVAPKSALINWRKEISVVFGDEPYEIHERQVPDPTIVEILKRDKRIFIILNYDILEHMFLRAEPTRKPYWSDRIGILKFVPDAMIIDEAHYIKNTSAKRTKLALYIAKRANHRLLLTATPIMNRAEELYPLLYALDPRTFWSKKEFLREFSRIKKIRVGRRIIEKHVGIKNAEKLRAILGDYADIKTVEQVKLQLPPKERIPHYIVASNEYYELERNFLAFAKAVYIENMASAYFGFIGGKQVTLRSILERHKLPHAIEYVQELIEQGVNRIVVFFSFKEPLHEFVKSLSPFARAYTGEVKHSERDDIIRWFRQPSTDVRIIAATIGALKESANLQVANHTVFAGTDWNPANIKQAEGRTRRIGSEYNVVFYHYFIADGSWIEEKIFDTIRMKEEMVKSITGQKDVIKFLVDSLTNEPDREFVRMVMEYRDLINHYEPDEAMEILNKEWEKYINNGLVQQ